MTLTKIYKYSVKADFHSVQNVARSIFCDRFLLKCVLSTTADEICSAWLFVSQKKAIAKSRLRNNLHWMEIRLLIHCVKVDVFIVHFDQSPCRQSIKWCASHRNVLHAWDSRIPNCNNPENMIRIDIDSAMCK